MKLFHQTIAIFSALLIMGWANTSKLQAQDESLEEILEGHFEAVGQENLGDVKSMTMKGKMMVMGMEFPMEIQQKRPHYYRTVATFQGMEMTSGYDGEVAWSVNPMQGGGKPVKLPEEQAKRTEDQANMDGLLYDYEEKGYSLELMGEEEVEGTDTYKLKLTKDDDSEVFIFLDIDSYIIIKTTAVMDMMGQTIEAETFFSNYKMIDGVAIAHSIESKAGEQNVVMQFDKIEFNVELDDELFAMPSEEGEEDVEEVSEESEGAETEEEIMEEVTEETDITEEDTQKEKKAKKGKKKKDNKE